ncbi:uncharacterized protein LOC110862216 [Folsomia candida]|uniref:Uncharacterized protein n=1 Tax=Folsomia candida TaxID=158441 RepID=A0A226CYW4_FOLCA|nr:uncharacterized protein LOC110862216 [Folsomia candida]OXA37990.1 hypothetical protein Fcan01_27247 [Folsomia candida]
MNQHFASLCSVILFLGQGSTALGGCSDDSTCTSLCGYAGAGKCVNGTHCVCETCPHRSFAELVSVAETCVPEPLCHLRCPKSSFAMGTAGRLYVGHICAPVKKPWDSTCICFCMPPDFASIGTVLRCPVLPNIKPSFG